jgi:F-type H+-transporting ATPase subunit gamma
MPNLKDLKKRMNSVSSTQKITAAMKVVAGSKLKKAEVAAQEGRPYAQRMERMLGALIAGLPNVEMAPKLLAGTGRDDVHLIIVITGDRGLCGGFNVSVVRAAKRSARALIQDGKRVKFLCVGKKGSDGLRREYAGLIVGTLENVTRAGAQFGPARDISRQVRNMFDAGEFDVCSMIYNTFKSAMTQEVTIKQLIPFRVPEVAAAGSESGVLAGYELEPSEDQLLASLLPSNISVQVFRALLESYASEQGARMTAMDNATRNAGDLIDKLTLTYNRSRQASITKELIEIISGAEAV